LVSKFGNAKLAVKKSVPRMVFIGVWETSFDVILWCLDEHHETSEDLEKVGTSYNKCSDTLHHGLCMRYRQKKFHNNRKRKLVSNRLHQCHEDWFEILTLLLLFQKQCRRVIALGLDGQEIWDSDQIEGHAIGTPVIYDDGGYVFLNIRTF
jgi:hypothetical protein